MNLFNLILVFVNTLIQLVTLTLAESFQIVEIEAQAKTRTRRAVAPPLAEKIGLLAERRHVEVISRDIL